MWLWTDSLFKGRICQRKTNLNGYQVHSYVGIYFYIFDYKSTYKLYFQSKIKRAKVKAGLWVGKAKFGNWTLSLNYGPHDKSSLIQSKLPTWLTHEARTGRHSSSGVYMCYSVSILFCDRNWSQITNWPIECLLTSISSKWRALPSKIHKSCGLRSEPCLLIFSQISFLTTWETWELGVFTTTSSPPLGHWRRTVLTQVWRIPVTPSWGQPGFQLWTKSPPLNVAAAICFPVPGLRELHFPFSSFLYSLSWSAVLELQPEVQAFSWENYPRGKWWDKRLRTKC